MRVWGLAGGLAMIALAAGEGCGSNDCRETATCAAPDEAGGDGSLVDAPTGGDAAADADATNDAPSDSPLVSDHAADSCSMGEDCANGMDDDCNGLADCADPACQSAGYACETPAPTGWSGPV